MHDSQTKMAPSTAGFGLKGQGNEIAIETMELAYDRIDIS